MTRSNLALKLLVLLFIPYLVSCRKDIHGIDSVSTTGKPAKDGPIPAYVFAWDTYTSMPSASSGTTNPIPMPWNSGTTAIDPNLAPDYLPADGWKLVWNTFSPTTVLGDPNYTYFFALYNVYRGLLRFYLWQPASASATSYVNHGLSNYTTGTTSPMLNFNATEVVNQTSNQTKFSNMLNQQINSAQGTWFAFQYEMAYDPNIANLSFPNFGLEWTSQWVNVTQVKLNGSQVGTINGYLGDPGAGAFSFGSLIGNGVTTFLGGLNYSAMLNQLTSNNDANPGPPENPYSKALTNALSGIAKGLFNGILGGSTSPTTAVNLTINTQIQLAGTQVSNGGMEDVKLVLPGQANSQTANGNTPAYNNILGVFNMTGTPTVKAYLGQGSFDTQDPYSGDPISLGYYINSYKLDLSTVHLIWNPAVINTSSTGAAVQNLNIQAVVSSNYAFGEGSGPVQGPYPQVTGEGTIEHIGNYSVAASISDDPMRVTYDSWDGSNVAVRVTFDVVPNNGGKKCTIVKTFKANLVWTTIPFD